MFETVEMPFEAKYGETDNSAIFTKDPRYGLWSLSFKRGDIPQRLKGWWQSLPHLQKKTRLYLESRAQNKATLGDPVEHTEEDRLRGPEDFRKQAKSR